MSDGEERTMTFGHESAGARSMEARLRRWMRAALVVAALVGGSPLARPEEPRVIDVTAKRFSFTPGEIRLRRGEPVTLRIHSADVTHGLYLRPLGIDAEIEAGKTAEVTFTPQMAGRFTAICDHFCGSGHGNMHLELVVE